MRFMIIRKADAETEAGAKPTTELLAAMGNYMEEMVKAGILLGGEGVAPSSEGTRIQFKDGKPSVIDGPFAETKELLAGYAFIQVKSRDEAIEWLKRWPVEDADGNANLELRRILEAEDFGAEFTPELREAEDRMRAEMEGKR